MQPGRPFRVQQSDQGDCHQVDLSRIKLPQNLCCFQPCARVSADGEFGNERRLGVFRVVWIDAEQRLSSLDMQPFVAFLQGRTERRDSSLCCCAVSAECSDQLEKRWLSATEFLIR